MRRRSTTQPCPTRSSRLRFRRSQRSPGTARPSSTPCTSRTGRLRERRARSPYPYTLSEAMTAQSVPAQPDDPAALVRRRRLSPGDPILTWTVRLLSWLALVAVVIMLIDTAAHSAKLLQHTSAWDFLIGTGWQPASTVYG